MRLLCICCLLTLQSFAQPPVGQWREHLPYGSVIDVTSNNEKVIAATPFSLFSVTYSNNSIERYSRITGLSETGVSAIQYDGDNDKLVVAYNNSNIDFIYRNDVINMPSIKQSTTGGDKSIYQIYPFRGNYYLSTGIGIIVVDGSRYEVKDSWFIGNNGTKVKINGLVTDETNFYAATGEGLKTISINNQNPSNYSQWSPVPALTGNISSVVRVANVIIVQKDDSLFAFRNNNWEKIFTSDLPIIKINSSNGLLYVSQRSLSGVAKVSILNSSGTITRVISQPGVVSFPMKAIFLNNSIWIADQFGGLSRFTATGFEQYKPNSPEATASGEMTTRNKIFYATAGEVNEAWNYQYNGNGIYKFENGEWTNINRYRHPQIDSLLDYITIAVDPVDETVWTGSYGGGLLHIISPGTFKIFKQGFIGPTIGDPNSYRVAGLSFDQDQTLWVSNFGAAQPLVAKKKDGNWKALTVPFALNENPLTKIIVDDYNYKWIIAAKGNGLICFDDNHSVDNTNDDRWRRFTTGVGRLPDDNVLSIAKDRSGFIWVGTINGMVVLQCLNEVFNNNCEAVRPIVQQGNFAGYLFSGQEVRDIAVDGADRKWVATANGVFLISPTGQQVIYHFDESNSPLLSNDVKKITIDGSSGEVYFATLKGICSFRSTANEPTIATSKAIVFPNPVPPAYNGTIVIKDVPENSIIKITELDGRLVYQTRSLGGQAVWDGKDYKGRKISTGIYLVMAVTDPSLGAGKEKAVGKIVFIGR